MSKRKCTPTQLKNLAKGRKKRLANLRKRKKTATKSKKKRAPPRKKRKKTMTKRRCTELSGGLGDINPQYYNGSVKQTSPNTLTNATFSLPVPRYSSGPNQAIVIEVLKVFIGLSAFAHNVEVIETLKQVQAAFGTIVTTSAKNLSSPDVWAFFQKRLRATASVAATGSSADVYKECPNEMDLTDGAGHGLLLGTDTFNVQLWSSNEPDHAFDLKFKLYYRFKRIRLVEYIGLVQQQQSGFGTGPV